MSTRTTTVYALIGLALVVWWAATQSALPVIGFFGLTVVAAAHALHARRKPGVTGATSDEEPG